MIVVTVHLASAVDGRLQQLARMHICNDGQATTANPRLGDYIGQTFVGRDADALAKGRVAKRAEVRGWRRHDFHVWNLVRRMLDVMGYDKGVKHVSTLRIVAAAFRFDLPNHDDPRAVPVTVSAPPPARHHNLFALAWPLNPDESGFLLSDGSFADRQRAAEVAIAAGQVQAEAMTVPGKLFSEDLW